MSGIFPCCSSTTSSSSHENKKKSDVIPIAISIIMVLGGIFMLLAAYEILPSGPNFLSNGNIGKVGGVIVTGMALTALLFSCLGEKILEVASPKDKPKNELSWSLQNPIEMRLSDLDFDYLKCTDELILSHGPRKISDNAPVDFGHLAKQGVTLKLMKISIELPVEGPVVKSDFEYLRKLVNREINNFAELYEKGRCKIVAIEETLDPAVKRILENNNEAARLLNQKIEEIRDPLVKFIAIWYPKEDAPPEAFNSKSEAVRILHNEWLSIVNSSG